MNETIKRDSVNGYLFTIILLSEVILAFSSMGYIVMEPLSITFMYVPVLICAVIFGPKAAALSGLVFGLSSMWKAGITATVYADTIFSPFTSKNPIMSLILSVGTRLVFGILAGYLFYPAKKMERFRILGIGAAAIIAKKLHAVLVFGCMQLWFPETNVMVQDAFTGFASLKNMTESIVLAGIVVLVDRFVRSHQFKTMSESAEMLIRNYSGPIKRKTFLIFSVSLVAVLSTLSLHFYDRMKVLFQINGVVLDNSTKNKMVQLFLQYQTAMMALMAIFGIILVFMLKYSFSLAAKTKKDLMTGLLNRTGVIEAVNDCLVQKGGHFIMIDIDNFKKINDTYGHPYGDHTLIEVAEILSKHFGKNKLTGRLGGDEFCIFVKDSMGQEELIDHIKQVQKAVRKLKNQEGAEGFISVSIGIAEAHAKEDFHKIYKKADVALYHVKKSRKNNFEFYNC